MALQRIKEEAEKAKKDLSGVKTTQISLPFITQGEAGPLHLNMNLTGRNTMFIVITLIIVIAAALTVVIYLKQISKNIFRCKKCSAEFKVNWKKLLFITHYENEYNISCPKCGNKGCLEQK